MPNGSYWKRRMEAIEKMSHDKGADYAEYVKGQFEDAIRSMEKEIEVWYYRIAENNDISLAAAKKLLKKNELEDFHMTVKEYIKKGETLEYSDEWAKALENASAKVHISRLEAMKFQLRQECEALYGSLENGLGKTMKGIYENGYYQTAYEIMKGKGVGYTFHRIDARRIEKAIDTVWAGDGKNFRARCWISKEKLAKELQTVLTQSIIRGEAPDKAIKQLAKRMNVSKFNAGRLIMTESAFISSQSQKDCYKELDVEQFQFVATLDSLTSDLCRAMDLKVFKMSDYEIGVNAPPLHCFCRSCTVPYFEDNYGVVGKRAARGADGKVVYVDADMTYEEWKEKFLNDDNLETEKEASNVPPHDKPVELGKIDFSNKEAVLSKIKDYEKIISDSDIENAVVVTKSGRIVQCFGNLNGVYPDIDLGDELRGAIVTHNHPVGSDNEYSFSKFDISLFIDNGLEILRGIDEKYVYELTRNASELDGHLSLKELTGLDGSYARHEFVISIAEQYGIGYRRWKR